MKPHVDPERVHAALAAALETSRARWLAGLVRRSRGDFERAEDALAEACADALEQWLQRGIPADPGAWIGVVARRRLADDGRAARTAGDALSTLGRDAHAAQPDRGPATWRVHDARIDFGSDDDTLRLIFTCCHPALGPESRVALTLNAVSGLDAGAIARAFWVDEAAMAKRLTRAKQKIRDAGIPFGVLAASDVPERLPFVLKAIELIFNEGYAQARGAVLDAPSLSAEGLRLARALAQLMPRAPEPAGLLALILFTHARRGARTDPEGALVRLPDQDRSLWDTAMIDEAKAVISEAVRSGGEGRYVLRAALSGEHSTAGAAAATRWDRIVGLYDALLAIEPSPMIELNRAVAVLEAEGPAAGLAALDAIETDLEGVHYAHALRAEAWLRMGRRSEARDAFLRALELASNGAERAYLRSRVHTLEP